MKQTFDAIVVGARCAGAATAMLMAQGGMSVLLVDWAEAGSDTMSTHALMRGATMQLSRWGVLEPLLEAGTPVVTKTTFHYGDEVIPIALRPSFGTPGLIAPRRHLLDRTLVAAARAAGVTVRFQTAFRDLVRDAQGRVIGAVLQDGPGSTCTVRAGLVVGADGRRSSVAARAGARTLRQAAHSSSCLYQYVEGLTADGFRWYYAPDFAAGAIPTNDGAHCVFAAARPSDVARMTKDHGTTKALARLAEATNAELGSAFSGARALSHPVLFRGATGFVREATGPGWALVGDAGYFKDPVTAHGITDALRDAEFLARAALRGGDAAFASYEKTRNVLSEDLFDVTSEIASFDLSMEDLKAAHVRLNAAMKAEQNWMAEAFSDQPMAA